MNMNTQGFKYQAFHEYLNTNMLFAVQPEVKRFVPRSWNDHKKSGILQKDEFPPRPRLVAPEPSQNWADTRPNPRDPFSRSTSRITGRSAEVVEHSFGGAWWVLGLAETNARVRRSR